MPGFLDKIRAQSPLPRAQAQATVANEQGADASSTHASAAHQRELRSFVKDAQDALKESNDASARGKLAAALAKVCDLTTGHADVQDAVAACLVDACKRWGTGNDAVQLMRSIKPSVLSRLDLSLVADHHNIEALSDFLIARLSWDAPGFKNDAGSSELIVLFKSLSRNFPAPSIARLDMQVRDLVLRSYAATNAIDTGSWLEVHFCVQALACINDPRMSTLLATDLMREALRTGQHVYLEARQRHVFDGCVKHIIQVAPELSSEGAATCCRALLSLHDNRSSLALNTACAAALTRAQELDALAPDLAAKVPAVLSGLLSRVVDGSPESIPVFDSAIKLAGADRGKVGLRFAKFCAELDGHEFATLPREKQIHLAVLSFHLDSGDHPYFEIEEHDRAQEPESRTVRIDYPPWLVDLRTPLADIWMELRSAKHSRQNFHILESVSLAAHEANQLASGINIDYATRLIGLEIHETAGAQVRTADWPALKDAMTNGLPGR